MSGSEAPLQLGFAWIPEAPITTQGNANSLVQTLHSKAGPTPNTRNVSKHALGNLTPPLHHIPEKDDSTLHLRGVVSVPGPTNSAATQAHRQVLESAHPNIYPT